MVMTALTSDDVLAQRLDEQRPVAVGTGSKGPRRATVRRSDFDDDWRSQFLDKLWRAYCKERGIRQPVTWPAARGPHPRLEVRERFLFRGRA